jgi:uncharacterized membrane protein YeaQ/YmgE (transglycosylase-associated protein family)
MRTPANDGEINQDHKRGKTLSVPTEHHPSQEELMIGFIITMIIVGAIAGFLARLIVPGRDPMGVVATIVLGIVGSFVGGFLGYLLFGRDASSGALQPSGIIGSIIGAIIALLIYRAVNRRGVGV